MAENQARPSFLQDVLTTAGQVEISDIKARITDVTTSISQLKVRVFDHMKSMYVDFEPLLKRDMNFVDQANKLSQEMETLFNRIEVQTKRDLANSTGELRQLHDTLKEYNLMISITSNLINIERTLKHAEKAGKEQRFLDAAKALNSFQDELKNSHQDLQFLDIYKSLKEEYLQQWESFCSERTKSLSMYIVWEEINIGNDRTRFSLKVLTDDVKSSEEVVKSLHLLDMLKPWIHKLQTALMRSVLLPLMEFESIVLVADDEKSSTLNVDILRKSQKPSCLAAMSNLTKCFEFLHGDLDINFHNDDTFISLLGSEISEEFADSLVKKCLKDTVPSTSAHGEFSEVLEKAKSLHSYLSGIGMPSLQMILCMVALLDRVGFILEHNQCILDFVQNVDILCTNKACELYLSNAREIMKKDLQNMVEVGPQVPTSSLSFKSLDGSINATINDTVNNAVARELIRPQCELNPNLFQFPQCCVSKSTIEILELVRNILNAASSNSEQGGLSLFRTARSVFQLYMAVVPSYHDKFLNTIPQQVALFHNNCMYLADALLVLGFEMETLLSAALKSSVVLTFVDLVRSLRDLGTSTFLKHMQHQRKQILDIVKNSGLSSLGEKSDLSPDTEKSLRQCLRQLELLMQVWQGVLPSNVYNKSIGILVNSFIEDLVIRVTCVEDIPANTATGLTSLFEMVSKRIPAFFLDGREVVLHVKKWQKFQELILVLGASLRAIEERWADGRGPLAQEFTMDQVKQLIRALFQNTKRRAEVLAKIR